MPSTANIYAQWRASFAAGAGLREGSSSPAPAERLLQRIWQAQRLRRDELRTTDGRKIRILHPGFWNREAGPDFHSAAIQMEGSPSAFGSVEIDLRRSGWTQHGHAGNPAYQNVILHVVWEEIAAETQQRPILALKPFLDAPPEELAVSLGVSPESEFLAGQCCSPLKNLSPAAREDLLSQAARVRLEAKASQFLARARQAGWTQALWEGLFAALGYKRNVWPMRRLAELIPAFAPEQNAPPLFSIQACLLGASGLLPAEMGRPSDAYVRSVWDVWWRTRDSFQGLCLPRALWQLSGARPANRPERRLALAAHWLASGILPERLEQWLLADVPRSRLLDSLREALKTPDDSFWSRHWTLQSRPMPEAHPLLGPQRASDLAVNVILPWLWSRTGAAADKSLQSRVEERYFSWPEGEDNSLLRLARQRLFSGGKSGLPRTAATQQGLLQIVRDFCSHSDALCQRCEFPALVARMGA